MKKGEIIDLVLLRINGGVLSSDNSVRREDVSAIISPALSLVIKNEQRLRTRESTVSLRAMGYATSHSLEDLYTTFTLTPIKDEKGRYCINLPYEPQKVASAPMIRNVMPSSVELHYEYVYVRSKNELIGLKTDISFFWYEKTQSAPKLYFWNIQEPICDIDLDMVLDADGLSDEDDISVPGGLEIDLINICAEWFSGQKMTLSEYMPDGLDDSKKS